MIGSILLQVVAPVLSMLLKLLVQLKILKSEAEARAIEERFKMAMQAADGAKNEPVSAHQQYDAAKEEARKKWDETFGNKP